MPPTNNTSLSSLDREHFISEFGKPENQRRPSTLDLLSTAATALEQGLLLETLMIYNVIDSRVDHMADIFTLEGTRGGNPSSDCTTQPNTPSRVTEYIGYQEMQPVGQNAFHSAQAVPASVTAWSDWHARFSANDPGLIGRYLGLFAPATGASFSVSQSILDGMYSPGLFR